MIPVIDQHICTGCRKCVDVCPPRAIELHQKKARIEEEFCEECGYCTPECPVNAIVVTFPRSENAPD
jgi:heterodisulfide reductase subunit A-like polyferredoxin